MSFESSPFETTLFDHSRKVIEEMEMRYPELETQSKPLPNNPSIIMVRIPIADITHVFATLDLQRQIRKVRDRLAGYPTHTHPGETHGDS